MLISDKGKKKKKGTVAIGMPDAIDPFFLAYSFHIGMREKSVRTTTNS